MTNPKSDMQYFVIYQALAKYYDTLDEAIAAAKKLIADKDLHYPSDVKNLVIAKELGGTKLVNGEWEIDMYEEIAP